MWWFPGSILSQPNSSMGRFCPPCTFSAAIGSYGVCKSKSLHWEDTQKGFWSKKFLWPGPEGLEVGPAENFGALKSGFFYFGLKFWPLNQGLHPKLSYHHIDIGLSLHLQKKLGQLVQKSPSYVNFCKA